MCVQIQSAKCLSVFKGELIRRKIFIPECVLVLWLLLSPNIIFLLVSSVLESHKELSNSWSYG